MSRTAYLKQVPQERQLLQESQKQSFPYILNEFGLSLVVHKNVFPPSHFSSWSWTITNFPSVVGQRVLEIGCGIGLPVLYLAKNGALEAVAVDINSDAVRNTQENARRNGLKNVKIFESDIFSTVNPDDKFDTIYWNIPFTYVPDTFEYETDLERSLFDPGYRMLRAFLIEGPSFLKPGGRILLGFGNVGRADMLQDTIAANGLSIKLLARGKAVPDSEVDFELYEIRP